MKRQTRADLGMAAAILLLGFSLVFSGTSLLRLHAGTLGTSVHFELAEVLGIVAAAAGVALLCWWIFALVCTCLTTWAQSRGSIKVARFSESFSPAFMRRLVAAVLGLNLLAAPLAHAETAPGVDPQWHAEIVATAPADIESPSPDESTPVLPHWVPHAPDTDPGLLLGPATRPNATPGKGSLQGPGLPGADPTEVVVQRGDSLWSIVAAALGPFSTEVDVAHAWPAWYQANRATIGPDPHLIFPGQVLQAPSEP